MMSLTAENRANLEKLATYLESLPEDYAHFGMADYFGDNSKAAAYALRNGGVANCGTVACAAGHGPAAGVLVPTAMVHEDAYRPVDWDRYTELFIGADFDLFDWVFGGDWCAVDDHHYGAASRIRYLLHHGQRPAAFIRADPGFVGLYAPFRIDAQVEA